MAIQDNLRIEPPGFSAVVRELDGTTVVELIGELDLSTAGALREVLLRLPLDSAPSVHINLREIEFLGSTGVGLIVTACKRIRASGGTFSLSCDGTMTRLVLEIAGLVDYLNVEDLPAG